MEKIKAKKILKELYTHNILRVLGYSAKINNDIDIEITQNIFSEVAIEICSGVAKHNGCSYFITNSDNGLLLTIYDL